MQLDRLVSETRSKQKINEEREKQVGAAFAGLKSLKITYGDAKKRLGPDRCFKVISAKDLTTPSLDSFC